MEAWKTIRPYHPVGPQPAHLGPPAIPTSALRAAWVVQSRTPRGSEVRGPRDDLGEGGRGGPLRVWRCFQTSTWECKGQTH